MISVGSRSTSACCGSPPTLDSTSSVSSAVLRSSRVSSGVTRAHTAIGESVTGETAVSSASSVHQTHVDQFVN